MNNERVSSFELIRVLAQYFIVLYHILLVIVYEKTGIGFFKAMWLPLHIGVPLFVMISGYFGIKTNLKRFVKLIGMVFVLQVPLLIASIAHDGGDEKDYISLLFFVSNTPFWFVRTYICLFLFAPVINHYLRDCSVRQRVLLLIVLSFMSVYIGTLKFDPSLDTGKNLVSFIFYYVLGDTLHKYEGIWRKIPRLYLALIFLVVNILLVVFFSYHVKERIPAIIFSRLLFDYTSIGLLLNSLVFFMLIGGMKFHSKLVNRMGKSSLAMYMLHGTPLVIYRLLPPVVMFLYYWVDANVFLFMMLLLLLTSVIVVLCWLVYEALSPLWRYIDRVGDYAQKKYYLLVGV